MFRIDPAAPGPLFGQIVDAVKRDMATGRLKPGDRLPPVREVARDLVISPNTIAKAYRALETEGVTVSRRGAGTFVAERRAIVSRSERRRRFKEALDAALTDAIHLGLTRAEATRAFEAAMRRFRFRDGEDS
jgi:GntR family transcriptional regulator